MNKSEDIKDIATALNKAQSQMATAIKGDTATVTSRKTGQTYTYNYATMQSIVDAIRVPFAENGLSFTQLPQPFSGNAVVVETALLHSSGQWISNEVRIPVSVEDAQAYGSALTYACKYGLRAIAGIPTSEDDDGAAAVKAKPRATEAEMMPRTITPFTKEDMMPKATSIREMTPADRLAALVTGELSAESLKAAGPYNTMTGAPISKTTFEYKKGQYSTAGMTKDQFISSLGLAKDVTVKYKDPHKAHKLLIDEFGVTSRSELTEDTAAQYLARLQELKDSD